MQCVGQVLDFIASSLDSTWVFQITGLKQPQRHLCILAIVTQVLLAGKDWQARALLRAQLIEEGLDVEAHESVHAALEGLELRKPRPALLIADLSESDDPPADVDQLTHWSKRVPVWIIASHTLILAKGLKGRGFEMILFRPLAVGELVEQIKRRLAE